MNNSFNKTELVSTSTRLSDDYKQQDNNLVVTIGVKDDSAIEGNHFENYVSAMRNENTESVTFLINVGVDHKSEEIRRLNAILEDEPIMTFVSSEF